MVYLSGWSVIESPVEYYKEISSKYLGEIYYLSTKKSYTNDFIYQANAYIGYEHNIANKIVTSLDPSCVSSFEACYCIPNSPTPYLKADQGVCIASCPNYEFLGTCVDACPSG